MNSLYETLAVNAWVKRLITAGASAGLALALAPSTGMVSLAESLDVESESGDGVVSNNTAARAALSNSEAAAVLENTTTTQISAEKVYSVQKAVDTYKQTAAAPVASIIEVASSNNNLVEGGYISMEEYRLVFFEPYFIFSSDGLNGTSAVLRMNSAILDKDGNFVLHPEGSKDEFGDDISGTRVEFSNDIETEIVNYGTDELGYSNIRAIAAIDDVNAQADIIDDEGNVIGTLDDYAVATVDNQGNDILALVSDEYQVYDPTLDPNYIPPEPVDADIIEDGAATTGNTDAAFREEVGIDDNFGVAKSDGGATRDEM